MRHEVPARPRKVSCGNVIPPGGPGGTSPVKLWILEGLKIFCTFFKPRIIYAIRGYLNFNSRIIYAIRGYFEFKTMLLYAFWGYFEFMGIYRVYGDISSYHLHILHCKIMTVSHVTRLIFHGECTKVN